MKLVSLWSGGKDSCYACYKAFQKGHDVVALFNFAGSEGTHSLSHGLPLQLIRAQGMHTGIPLLQQRMPKQTYREAFLGLIEEWKKKAGIEGIVFGDIYLQEHRDWIDKVCSELRVQAIMPLWGAGTGALIREIIRDGFKTVVVSTRADCLGPEWLGKTVDAKFIEELERMGGIDLCGEKGEFHTFVYDGPLFKRPVEFVLGERVCRDGHWFFNFGDTTLNSPFLL